MMFEDGCYCGAGDIEPTKCFTCEKCKRNFHAECLKSTLPSPLKGDLLFSFTCDRCGDGREEFERIRLQWLQVVQLTLYNLHLGGTGMCGYFRWKEHICAFIDKHWNTFFGSHRKKTSLWHGTVAGVLSSGCPSIFSSGSQELKESGWWRLVEMKPPVMSKQGTPTTRSVLKRKEVPTGPIDTPKEGLRSRRGKTSIQAAMELKAKRSTLMEAKDIRKSKSEKGSTSVASTPSLVVTTETAKTPSLLSAQLTTPSLLSSHLVALSKPVVNSPLQTITPPTYAPLQTITPPTYKSTPVAARNQEALVFTGLFDSRRRKSSSSSDQSLQQQTGSLLVEHLIGGTPMNPTPGPGPTGSVQDFSDESSEVSQSSYLTEKDLKPADRVPNLLMSDDFAAHDSDSDLEIDPGTISPPPQGTPIRMQESPTVEELLSTIDSESSNQRLGQLEDSNLDYSNQGSSFSMDTSYQGSVSMETSNQGSVSMETSFLTVNRVDQLSFNENSNQDSVATDQYQDMENDVKEEASVVDSESDSESESESSADEEVRKQTKVKKKRKVEKDGEKEQEKETPKVNYYFMSSYEERSLLKQLESISSGVKLPPHINRLKRKLIVRQLKRENGLPQFDLDAEMNKLSQKCWGLQYGFKERQGINHPAGHYHGDMRILDKYQTSSFMLKSLQQKQPSFLNRLVGTEDDQLQSICSPYTTRVLKPFIRRDYESRPIKMQLLEEIKAYPHRHDPHWKPPPPPPIDYCYVRPQHIASVNTLCREFFWPGIDLSECLQYPDFSCVVLFRKIVIGFAFMVPDVKQNEAYISFIFTHPEWRRAGMATFMLYHLIQTCMGKDVTLHVSATNTAMLLYQKFGFKPEEFILDFYDKYYPPDTKECKHAFFLRLRR